MDKNVGIEPQVVKPHTNRVYKLHSPGTFERFYFPWSRVDLARSEYDGPHFRTEDVMSTAKSAVVLAVCVLSHAVLGAETRRALPGGRLDASKTPDTVSRPPVVSFADASKVLAPYKQWIIGANKTGLVHPGFTGYNLKGTVIRKFLQYEKQGAGQGINLGWTDDASASTATESSKWFFRKLSNEPVRYGERVAIAWNTAYFPTTSDVRPFIKYSRRRVGINLDWTRKPSYEWAILGGKPGNRVKRGEDLVILYNLQHKRPLMYFNRTVGGDIGWPDSTRWQLNTFIDTSGEAAMEAAVKALLMPGV